MNRIAELMAYRRKDKALAEEAVAAGTMTAAAYNKLFAGPGTKDWRRSLVWPEIQAIIRADGREFLRAGDIVEMLLPVATASNLDRRWLFAILRKLAIDRAVTAGWCKRGQPFRLSSGVMVEPWLWSIMPLTKETGK